MMGGIIGLVEMLEKTAAFGKQELTLQIFQRVFRHNGIIAFPNLFQQTGGT